ncbi:unnamed protein product [Ilex paraguariensis]|uniref:WEB family protein n=1 Tax=Ilex paraguariensis TaxID=185542 RepID=A0ABC8RRB8_9AQUA
METPTLSPKPAIAYHSNVDTSTPFSSVKEAVAIFGERFLAGEIYSPKPFTFPKHETSWKFSPSPQKSNEISSEYTPNPNKLGDENALVDTLKKLEADLEETKMELKLLKERGSETEVALASLNAELHKNMSRLAKAEAVAAAKAVASRSTVSVQENGKDGVGLREEERRDSVVRMENSRTLAEILSLDEKEGMFVGRKERKIIKKKPIIPLVGDLFWRKKGSSTTLHNPLYSSAHINLN